VTILKVNSLRKFFYEIKVVYLGLTYQNDNSHHSHENSNGKTSLGKKTGVCLWNIS